MSVDDTCNLKDHLLEHSFAANEQTAQFINFGSELSDRAQVWVLELYAKPWQKESFVQESWQSS